MKRRARLIMVLFATTVVWAQGFPSGDRRQDEIPFETTQNFGVILIKARVNGQSVSLLVDTGSSRTILRSDLLQVNSLALPQTAPPAKGSGYTGGAAWARATLEIGRATWRDHRVLVMNDFGDLSRSMGRRVDGILGEDVLQEFESIVIDFKHHRLLLH